MTMNDIKEIKTVNEEELGEVNGGLSAAHDKVDGDNQIAMCTEDLDFTGGGCDATATNGNYCLPAPNIDFLDSAESSEIRKVPQSS